MNLIRNKTTFQPKTNADGNLVVIEALKDIPFEIKRAYYVYGVGDSSVRGKHAHYKTEQIAICINGSVTFILDDGRQKETVLLDKPNESIALPAMLWHEMYNFSQDCVLLVFADSYYDEADYIRDYKIFKQEILKNNNKVDEK